MAAFLALAVLPAAGAVPANVTFDDPAGDQRNTEELVAPDITSVHVSNTRDGLVTFRLTIANHAALPPNSRIAVLFDLDKRQETGDQGFEYTVRHETDAQGQTSPLVFERWEDEIFQLVQIPSTGLTSSFADGVFTLSVPRSSLENTVSFEFGLYAAALDVARPNRSAVDSAPDANLWRYDLVGLPAPRLSTSRMTAMPGRPVAGKAFTVGAQVTRSDTSTTLTSASVRCLARIGKSRVRAVGRFSGGRARCVVTVPRTAKGKTLRLTITVRAVGAVHTRTLSYRVR